MSLHQLVWHLRIGDQRTSKRYEIGVTALDERQCRIRVVRSGIEQRYMDRLPRMRTDIGHAGLSQIGRREDIVERLIAAGIEIERIHAFLLQLLQDLHAVSEISAAFKAMIQRDAKQDRHIRPDHRAHRSDDFLRKLCVLLRGTAVFVGPLVPYR